MYNKKKLFIIIATIAVLMLIIGIIITVATSQQKIGEGRQKTVIIDNARSYQGDLDPSIFISIGDATYATIIENLKSKPAESYYGEIRNDSFERGEANVTFILDIPSIKMSWEVASGVNKDREPTSSPTVMCITKNDAIYPLIEQCGDMADGFQTPEQEAFMAMTKILPLIGPSYEVRWENTAANPLGYKLIATVYGAEGKNDVAAAFTSLEYDITQYPVEYIQK